MPVLVHTSTQEARSLACTTACDRVGRHAPNTATHSVSQVIQRRVWAGLNMERL